ncbi:PAS domain-containing sensor histidine kinase [Haloferax namakaokahaiae]|uniref:histidine kinase n=1 Tax=Haloferax namakaokahaiae TaxID=1748331 RepID=A0ABD5ZHC8_9EURY
MVWDQSETESERLFSNFAQRDPDVFFMFSPDWSELKYVDDIYEKIWGRPVSSLQSNPTSFLEGVHPADRNGVKERMEKLSRGEHTEQEFRVIPENNSAELRYVWVEGRPVYEGDELLAIAGFVRDITERKQRTKELERTNERLKVFTNFLSHDLQNQLNIANGWLQIEQQERESKNLNTVSDALSRMAELTDDVLALARLDYGSLDREPLSLAAIASDCWQPMATDGAELVVTGDVTIHVDRGLFRNVFENLFRNAIEHTEGRLTVRVGPIADGAGVYVEDDGCGIPADKRDAVFKLGYSTDGTGLGLALVREVIDAHGGEITATEGERGGARFEMTSLELS